MDPISQAAVGAAFTQTVTPKRRLGIGIAIGLLAGLAPDIDIFIKSQIDPLFSLKYHRHFTHSLLFIPIGGFLISLPIYFFCRPFFSYRRTFYLTTIGFATHGLLDACTSYGTLLLWPFSNDRLAWNVISIVDPIFTIVTILLLVLIFRYRTKTLSIFCVSWVTFYLIIGFIQNDRALQKTKTLAFERGHIPERVTVKPSIGNLLVWKAIYEHEDYYYVDAINNLFKPTVCPGERIKKFDRDNDLPLLKKNSQQEKDIEQFRWFSNNYLGFVPQGNYIIDIRYSTIPNKITPLWGIVVDVEKEFNEHVTWKTNRKSGKSDLSHVVKLIQGEGCER